MSVTCDLHPGWSDSISYREFKRYIHEGTFSNLLLHSGLGMANLYPECPLSRDLQLCDVGFFDRTGDFVVMFNIASKDPSETSPAERLIVPNEWIVSDRSSLEPGFMVSSDKIEVSHIRWIEPLLSSR